ncbi:myelin-associated neurite-outgrowth inhibitor isoform X1 [Chamaea fasciata]|uniref:myelin-associated neurite-outgrowth inhibitor isoform X1 n=1 Tax=Chamaea fasciata TaxID=190680 RepID=UPI00336A5345
MGHCTPLKGAAQKVPYCSRTTFPTGLGDVLMEAGFFLFKKMDVKTRRGFQDCVSQPQRLHRKALCHTAIVTEIMNPVYSPGSSGVPYANAKGIGYPAGFPMGYAAAAPAYSPNMYPGANPTFQTGYTPGTPYKVSCSPTSGAVPPYSSSPNPYQTAVYPVRSAYPQQNPYAQQGTYYTQPLYAAPPHVIHHTTVVQPNGMPATMYPAPIPPPRGNGVTMGMVAGTTMAMSAGTLLTTHSPTPVAPHPVTMPTYRAPGTPTYSYVPPQW